MNKFKMIVAGIKLTSILGLFFLAYKGCTFIKENGWHYQQNKTRTSEIYSLRTSSELRGSFVLGIGSIGNEDYYVFYRRTLSGGLLREKIKTSDCILYEGYQKPKITEVGVMGYHLQDGDTVETSFGRDDYSSGYNSIYIPKGTITERIAIDIN